MGEYNHNTELQRKTCGWHIKTVSKGQSEKGRQLNLLISGGKVSTGNLQSGLERYSNVHNTFSHQRNAMKSTSNRAAVMKRMRERLPWWSSGWDSSLPTKWARVRSLVGELRSFMLCSATKKKKMSDMKCWQECGATRPSGRVVGRMRGNRPLGETEGPYLLKMNKCDSVAQNLQSEKGCLYPPRTYTDCSARRPKIGNKSCVC